METALVTGMFETSFLPEKQVGLDVKKENTGSFSKILESSLKSNDVIKNETKDCKTEQDVSLEVTDVEEDLDTEQEINDEEVTKDVDGIIEELLDGIKENEGKTNKKDKKKKEEVIMNDLAYQTDLTKLAKKDECNEQDVELKIEDVKVENQDVEKMLGSIKNGENQKNELTPEEKLDNLLNKLDVELNENVKIKDESENVIEVGPQSVETEKIKLNINDVDVNKDVENLDELKNNEGQLITIKENEVDKLEDVGELSENKLEDVDGLSEDELEDVDELGEFENKFLESTGRKEKTEVDKNKDVKEDVSKSFMNKDVNNNGTMSKKEFKEDKGFSKSKEDRFKIKDFRNKEDVDTMQKFIKEEGIKLENNLGIKDVNAVRKFEDIDVNQMDILDQVTEKLEVSLFDNKSEMVIKLKPNDLGNVTVKITIENGVMNAKFLAESIKVKEALESNLNNLKESLKDQGLNVQDLNVSVDSGRSQNHNFNQNNLIYMNDKKSYRSSKVVGYEDSYYESVSDERKENHYWMDSTVSFLA